MTTFKKKKRGVYTFYIQTSLFCVLTCLNVSNYKGFKMLTSLFLNIFKSPVSLTNMLQLTFESEGQERVEQKSPICGWNA